MNPQDIHSVLLYGLIGIIVMGLVVGVILVIILKNKKHENKRRNTSIKRGILHR